MIKKEILLILVLASGLASCDFAPHETTDSKYKTASKSLRSLIKERCESSNTLELSLKGSELSVPCGHRQHIKIFHDTGEVDYKSPAYLNGSKSIPIGSMQLWPEAPDVLSKIWDVMPPIGTYITLYARPDQIFSQECKEYYEPYRSSCEHRLPIQGTNLATRLWFNRSATPALSISREDITPDKYPFGYHPDAQWPKLYEDTERFVKSLLIEKSD